METPKRPETLRNFYSAEETGQRAGQSAYNEIMRPFAIAADAAKDTAMKAARDTYDAGIQLHTLAAETAKQAANNAAINAYNQAMSVDSSNKENAVKLGFDAGFASTKTPYDNGRTYMVGDIISKDGKVYKMISGIGAAGYPPPLDHHWEEVRRSSSQGGARKTKKTKRSKKTKSRK